MKVTLRWLFALSFLLVAVAARGQEEKKKEEAKKEEAKKEETKKDDETKDPTKAAQTDYYPLEKGMTWTYKVGDKTFEVSVAGPEKVGEEQCIKLVTKHEGKEIATESVVVKKDGVYRCGFQGTPASKPLMFLKLPPVAGEKWKFNTTIAGREVNGEFTLKEEKGVKVPAGTYDTVKVESNPVRINDQNITTTYWFAPKVGLVKQVVNAGGTDIVLELEKFSGESGAKPEEKDKGKKEDKK